jgi:hypothetical protein
MVGSSYRTSLFLSSTIVLIALSPLLPLISYFAIPPSFSLSRRCLIVLIFQSAMVFCLRPHLHDTITTGSLRRWPFESISIRLPTRWQVLRGRTQGIDDWTEEFGCSPLLKSAYCVMGSRARLALPIASTSCRNSPLIPLVATWLVHTVDLFPSGQSRGANEKTHI